MSRRPLCPTMQPRDLSAHAVYRAGRGVEEVARDLGLEPGDLVKVASNENMYGPNPAAVEAIHESAGRAGSYPKTSHADLVERLADRWAVESEQVWLGPGADGAIDYLHRATLEPGDAVLVPDPGFAYYSMSARYHHGEVRTYPVPKARDFAQTPETVLEAYDGERIVFVTSPHNPTGSEMGLDDVATVAERVDEETLVAVDEAYGEFTEAPSGRELLPDHDNVAVLRTFSKAHGLAGLRIGYALVPSAWADAYARINTPFAANELACRAAYAALGNEEHVERTVETAREVRERYHEGLDARTWPSGGNFVLAEVGDGTAVAEAAEREGVILRDCSSFGLPDCVRITCGTPEEARTVVETVNGVLDR